jgi:hypothetical protein
LAAVDVEAEQPAPGDEERPALVEEGLVRGEVEHGRIGLDLPEVRVDRRVDREVRRDAILEIATERPLGARRIPVLGDARGVLGDDVRHRLESAWRLEIVESREGAELRYEAGFRLSEQRPAQSLVVAIDVAIDRESERVTLVAAVSQLRERNAKFGRPAERVDPRRHVPDAIPGAVFIAVVVDRLIHLDAGRVHAEFESGAPVVIRVDEQPDHVGRRVGIAPLENLDDAVGMRIERAHEHEQVGGVVGDFRLGTEPGFFSLGGLPLLERRDRRGSSPDGVVVPAVDDGGRLRPNGVGA